MIHGWTLTRQQVTWDDMPADLRDTDPELVAGEAWVLRQYDRVVDARRCLMRRAIHVKPGGPESAHVYQWLRHRYWLDLNPNAPDWHDYEFLAETLTAQHVCAQTEVLPIAVNDRSAA